MPGVVRQPRNEIVAMKSMVRDIYPPNGTAELTRAVVCLARLTRQDQPRMLSGLPRLVRRVRLCSGEKQADSDPALPTGVCLLSISRPPVERLLGSSRDATVTSIHSELTSSWINRGVPQQEANERNRSAYETLRSSPLRISIALLGTLHQVTYGAALARRQSSQWQSLPRFGLTCRR